MFSHRLNSETVLNINDLAPALKAKYDPSKGFGVVKVDSPGWENIPFVVPKPPPRSLANSGLPHRLISQALRVLQQIPRLQEMTELERLVHFLIVRCEVVQSSRLEGTWSTIDHALTPEEVVDAQLGKSEHVSVRQYAELLEKITQEALIKREKIFTESFICGVHRMIIQNDPRSVGAPGKLRAPGKPGSLVTIGGLSRKEDSIYNPAPPSEVKRCLGEVLAWLRDAELAQRGDAGEGLSLPVRLAIAHAHFEAVHPFTDGNGRAGRALWPVQMICADFGPLYLSGFVEQQKLAYVAALEAAQKKLNYNPLIEFMCRAIIDSHAETLRTQTAILRLEKLWLDRGPFRQKSTAQRTLRLLLVAPILTSQMIEDRLGVKKTAADDAIRSLVEKKILRHRSTEKRQRVFAAEELIAILSRPYGVDPEIVLAKKN